MGGFCLTVHHFGVRSIETIDFYKYSGSGNDFICIDNRDGRFDHLIESPGIAHFARQLCRRGIGVGADGVIFAGPTGSGEGVDIVARFFEPDGSEAELCGNGVGCFVYCVVRQGWVTNDREIRVLTSAGVVRGQVVNSRRARVCIPNPEDIRTGLDIEVRTRRWPCHYLVTGVPHLVVYVDDLDNFEIEHWGPAFRYHPDFAPRGVNANFVEVRGEGHIAVRTWEFGVEDETLACGTGSSSAAIVTAMLKNWGEEYTRGEKPVLVDVQSGDRLKVWFMIDEDGDPIDLCLETTIRPLYTGRLTPELTGEVINGEPIRSPELEALD